MKPYEKLCSEDDCYNVVKEDDIERDKYGNIYERSKKCWACRTQTDCNAIKKWRQKHRNKDLTNYIKSLKEIL
jgi:hypothetical protein